jgi:hypothetical protein
MITEDTDRMELVRERAELIRLLSTARHLLTRANIYVDGVINRDRITMRDPNYKHPAEDIKGEIETFLAAGLFGEKEVKSCTN